MRRSDHRGRGVEILWPSSPRAVAAEREFPEHKAMWGELRARALARRPWEVQGRRIILGCLPILAVVMGVTFWLSRDPEGLVWALILVGLSALSFWAARRTGLPEIVVPGSRESM